jgi:hypothetical protein
MEFEFEKFVTDIEKRSHIQKQNRNTNTESVQHDEARRLRDQMYFEKWQNRIVWRQNNEQ